MGFLRPSVPQEKGTARPARPQITHLTSFLLPVQTAHVEITGRGEAAYEHCFHEAENK